MAPVTRDKFEFETTTLIASEKVEGTYVHRPNGDKIGSIEHIMLDKMSGKVAYVVIRVDSFLDIDGGLRFVPWSLLSYNPKLGHYQADFPEEQSTTTAFSDLRPRSMDNPQSPPNDDFVVERAIRQAAARLPEIVHARRRALTERDIEALANVYLADDPIAQARASIAADNARERARFLTEVSCLTSRQIAEYAGHRATNTSITASRWKQQGRIFSIPWQGNELYPAFQFRDAQPHPTVAKALLELPRRFSPWQIAFWFTSGNGWLRGATPAERLDDEETTVAAARQEKESIVG